MAMRFAANLDRRVKPGDDGKDSRGAALRRVTFRGVGHQGVDGDGLVGAAQLLAHRFVAQQAADPRQGLQVIGAGALRRQ
jgi:hypothetical protein